MVNGIWGWYKPNPIRKKIPDKKRQMQSIWFLIVLSKSSLTTFWYIFETLSALRICNVTIIGVVVYKKSMNFEVFLRISQRVFMISLHEIFLGSKLWSITFDKNQRLDYGCSSYPGNEAQSPDFLHFRAFSELLVLTQAFSRGHWLFTKISSMHVLHV